MILEEDICVMVRIVCVVMGCIILCEVVWCKVNVNYMVDGIIFLNFLVLCI